MPWKVSLLATLALGAANASNAWSFQFESADCANDYFGGTAPDPATLSLMGLGLVAFRFKSKRVRSTFRKLHSRSS